MLSKVTGVLIFLVGVVNFLPIIGIISVERLSKGYGLKFEEQNLIILMRHRALMFGIIGSYILTAAFRPELRPTAIVFGFVNLMGFIVLALQVGGANSSLKKLVVGDSVACILMVIASALMFLERNSG